ncbi:MAG: nucleoside triphosphate pyrophosphohydrolase [Candidatus Taylorbacteria bacterium]|nr:nucleoside triphosphate pyrophosphohydrolase [Candidatus Taylorbacteria bacterium]
MMKYNKLVRDRIPEIIRKKGGNPKFHIAGSNYQFWGKLREKLSEEAEELLEAVTKYIKTEAPKDEKRLIEETADFLEILDAVLQYRGDRKPLTSSQINRILSAKRKKAKERGRFKKRIILEES